MRLRNRSRAALEILRPDWKGREEEGKREEKSSRSPMHGLSSSEARDHARTVTDACESTCH